MLSRNIPNIITILRMFCAPIICLMIVSHMHNQLTLIVWILCSISDMLDGMIARFYHMETMIGKYLDPLADKCLVNGSLLALVYINSITGIHVITVLIIIIRDIIISYYRNIIYIPVSYYGKLKTTVQMVAIGMIIMSLDYGIYLLWISSCISIYSMSKYVTIYKNE